MEFSRRLIFGLRRHARRASIAAALFALPLDVAHAGFFDFLFKPPPPPPPAMNSPGPSYHGVARPHYRPYAVFHERWQKPAVALHHSAHAPALALASTPHHHHHIVTATKTRHATVARAALPHAVPSLMEDDSLEEGDAVMTDRGIRIFTGDSGAHHSDDEFAKLSETKGLSKRERASLTQIDANRSEGGGRALEASDIMTGRSAADSGVSSGALIAGPNGRMIRYVGP